MTPNTTTRTRDGLGPPSLADGFHRLANSHLHGQGGARLQGKRVVSVC